MRNACKSESLFIGLLACVALLPCGAYGQTQQQRVPDCPVRTYTFTSTGVTADVDNTSTNCNTWKMDYTAVGFSGISMAFEAAPAATINAGSGAVTPGTYVAWGGTITNGVNPVIISPGDGSTRFTDTSAASTQGFFAAFVRVHLTSITGTGTIKVSIYGWRGAADPNTTGGGSGGTGCPNPCPVIGPDAVGAAPTHPPVQQGSFDGVDVTREFVCTNQAAFAVTGTSVQIVTGTAAKKIRICHLDFSNSAAANVTIQEGTGSVCGSGTATVAGLYPSVTTFAMDYQPTAPLVTQTAADNVCLLFGTSITSGGFVVYANF